MTVKSVLCASAIGVICGLPLRVIAEDAMPAFISAAVVDAGRPAADKQRDADRKPAETLNFAGVTPGAEVVELEPGGGYFTRLLSKVVGRHGKVYAVVPAPRPGAPAGEPDRSAPIKALAADPGYANVTMVVQSIKRLDLPVRVDVVWTSLNYHDVHNVPSIDMLAFNESIFDTLKPGGLYIVVDHAASADAPASVTSELHRINPDVVKQEVTAAGFVLEAQSDLLRNPNDPHTAAVFDPAIRGKTDQFMYKFRKPKK
jgi:predicted methyltransferase